MDNPAITPPRIVQCLAALYDHRFDPSTRDHNWHPELRRLRAANCIRSDNSITPEGIKVLEKWGFPIGRKSPS